MSEIFLDTETTGLSAKEGDRIVEIACIETKDLIPTNRVFHKLINPQKKVSQEAFKVHGFSDDFLKRLSREFDEPGYLDLASSSVSIIFFLSSIGFIFIFFSS